MTGAWGDDMADLDRDDAEKTNEVDEAIKAAQEFLKDRPRPELLPIGRKNIEVLVSVALRTGHLKDASGLVEALEYLKNWQSKDGAAVVVEVATEALEKYQGAVE